MWGCVYICIMYVYNIYYTHTHTYIFKWTGDVAHWYRASRECTKTLDLIPSTVKNKNNNHRHRHTPLCIHNAYKNRNYLSARLQC